MNKKWGRALAAVLSLAVLAVLATAGIVGAADPGTLTSARVSSPPLLDGEVDALWNNAAGVTIDVTGGANLPGGATKVNAYSVHTADSVYFMFEWWDPTESLHRSPWEKQADGTWRKLSTSTTHQESTNYEDKLALIWNINDSIKGFNQQGCMVACHAGEQPANSGYGSKYTASAGEIGDIWHFKSVRLNPVGQVDDQYVDDARYDKDKAPEAGRHADPKTGGGYADNQTDDKKAPKFGAAGQKPAPPYWILDSEKQPLDDSKYKAGDKVAGITTSPFAGDRADLSGKATYKDGKWVLEIGRKLDTGSKFDVQFTDLSKAYYFGVAIFDNTQVNHAFSGPATKVVFQTAASQAPAAQPAQPAPAALPRTGDAALPLLQLLMAAGGSLGLGVAIRRITRR